MLRIRIPIKIRMWIQIQRNDLARFSDILGILLLYIICLSISKFELGQCPDPYRIKIRDLDLYQCLGRIWIHYNSMAHIPGLAPKTNPKKIKHEKNHLKGFLVFFSRIFIVNHLVDYLNLTLNKSMHFQNISHVLKTNSYPCLYK